MDYKIASEYRDVALRPEHLDASGRTAENVLALIEAVESVAEPVLVVVQTRPLSPDPNDDLILDVAINGLADVVVTQNTKHFTTAAHRHSIRVLSPVELLETLREAEHYGE